MVSDQIAQATQKRKNVTIDSSLESDDEKTLSYKKDGTKYDVLNNPTDKIGESDKPPGRLALKLVATVKDTLNGKPMDVIADEEEKIKNKAPLL